MTGQVCNEPESKLSIGRRISLQFAVDEPYDWPPCLLTENISTRFAEPGLVEALADTPVVLIYGPRQFGKTTLDLEGQLSAEVLPPLGLAPGASARWLPSVIFRAKTARSPSAPFSRQRCRSRHPELLSASFTKLPSRAFPGFRRAGSNPRQRRAGHCASHRAFGR